jgi:hypothetical protein
VVRQSLPRRMNHGTINHIPSFRGRTLSTTSID